MKRSGYLLAGILVISMMGCQGQTPQKEVSNAKAGMAPTAQTQEEGAVHLTKADFVNLVMDYEKNPDTWKFKGEKPCLIDFYADWCAPCRITSPIIEDLAKQYAGKIDVYKIDIEKEQELAALFRVQSIPTFLFCPLEGIPTISSGIANTPAATRAMFIRQIEELLLKNDKISPEI